MNERYLELYEKLLSLYGPQGWWPADSPFEVMVGAILTQNTRWENVEKAIAELKVLGDLSPAGILQLPNESLKAAIRSSGYYNQKASRLVNYASWLEDAGGIERLRGRSLKVLREELLSLTGIGPETADDILLYAFNYPVFVIDNYTHRLAERYGLHPRVQYEVARGLFEANLPDDVALYQEFHALIVQHSKVHCLKFPRCERCPLLGDCAYSDPDVGS